MDIDANQQLPEGSQLAAIDLGSNSFHLIVAKIEHGEMRPIEALGEKVQLGAGLENGMLSQAAIDRGLECLTRFAQLLESVDPERIRVVGTNALRVADNRRMFTQPARQILRTPVEVIYGVEEARLVYLGVAHTLADDAQSRLVIDIGGGSTEFIIGERFEPRRLESLQMGCVSYTRACFEGDTLTQGNFQHAYAKACVEVSHIRRNYHSDNWAECVGSSGTLQAIETIVLLNGWSENGITRDSLANLEKHLLQFDTFDKIELEGLSNNRRNVLAAGVAITSALFDMLNIPVMRTSKGALREGVIYDLMGRLSHEDVRERTINALMQRYAVDNDNATIVSRRARILFNVTRATWKLNRNDWELLDRVARAHEIGMAISHKHFHKHSAYLLRNADLPGFSQEEQEKMAVLAQAHRGKLDNALLSNIPESEWQTMIRLIAIIRLAALFKYVEQLEQLPDFQIETGTDSLTLDFPEGWLDQHPLTARELSVETTLLERLGMNLTFS